MIESMRRQRPDFIAVERAAADGDRVTVDFEGRIDGELVWPPRGSRGFGYDPMFVPEGHSLTFGEMEPQAKHAMSHRARAFRQFVEACLG
jgi:XTP/dITP diphosphohydrolase